MCFVRSARQTAISYSCCLILHLHYFVRQVFCSTLSLWLILLAKQTWRSKGCITRGQTVFWRMQTVIGTLSQQVNNFSRCLAIRYHVEKNQMYYSHCSLFVLFYRANNKDGKGKYKICSFQERNLGKYLISLQLHKKYTIRKKTRKREHFDVQVHQSEQFFQGTDNSHACKPNRSRIAQNNAVVSKNKNPLLRKKILS